MVFAGLASFLLLAAVLAAGIGAVACSPGQTISIIASSFGLDLPWHYEAQQAAVVLTVRLPRVLLGMLVGAGLGLSGAAMQGLFRNPLADPSLIGASGGAALATVAVIVLGVPSVSSATLSEAVIQPSAAFVGALVVTLVVYRLSSADGRTSVATMLLSGVGVNAMVVALMGLLTFTANDAQLRTITFWTLGSLGGGTWQALAVAAPFMLLPLVLLPRYARELNALTLGEAEASHLGVDVVSLKRRLVALVALTIGAGVALTGIIGFVAILTPHILRLVVGPDHRIVLPGSALLGATLLVGADLVARTAVSPAELPVGVITALAGAPLFLWLLWRGRSLGAM